MELYRYLYRLLDRETPLRARDCGKLCNGACCEESDEGEGMYLFPGEEKLFSDKESCYFIDSTDFSYGEKTAKILICKGKCRRNMRPLSCRIFPLVPHRTNQGLELALDPRGRGICPFVRANDISLLSVSFYRKVLYAMKLVDRTREGRLFIDQLSKTVDELLKWRRKIEIKGDSL